MFIPRNVSASDEASPFVEAGEVEFEKQAFNTTPEAPRPRLDQQPHTKARSVNGRPLILESCMSCGTEGECVDTGAQVLCLTCDGDSRVARV